MRFGSELFWSAEVSREDFSSVGVQPELVWVGLVEHGLDVVLGLVNLADEKVRLAEYGQEKRAGDGGEQGMNVRIQNLVKMCFHIVLELSINVVSSRLYNA